MAAQTRPARGARCHMVLVPGFGGFDALGRVEYYSGITHLFRQWQAQQKPPAPVVLHYFDNLPTAAVVTRAARLRKYLAKRLARGQILATDSIVLVGHSTGGLDIRQLIWDLHKTGPAAVPADGAVTIPARVIRGCLKAVVFLSVPHWGTNIADWVYSQWLLRKTVIADLRMAFAGSQYVLLDQMEAAIAEEAASWSGADLLLALRDALTESNDRLCGPDPTRIVEAQEAASELELYFRHMATDFRVINDLTSQAYEGEKSPAHFDAGKRLEELQLWEQPRIRTLSYATAGGRPFHFSSPSGCRAPQFALANPCGYPEVAMGRGLSAGTDIAYRLCYRVCAGGPLGWPAEAGSIDNVLGPPPPQPLELWDNDGIVNTVSMLWPIGERTLVQADHLDIVGHNRLRPQPARNGGAGQRTYRSYDSLRSAPHFTERRLKDVWTEIFFFAIGQQAYAQHKKAKPSLVKLAAVRAVRESP
jgi:triacylglycerol lipase